MWMKKIAVYGLAAAMCISIAGCGKELPVENVEFAGSGAAALADMVPEEGAELTFWAADKEYGQAIAKAFESKYGVPVTAEQEGLGTTDKIALSGPGGEGADVYMSPHDSVSEGLAAGVFMKLEDAVVDHISSRVTQTAIHTVTSDGDLYGVPVSMEVNCLFYNKDIIDQPAATLEEIMEKAADFNDPANNKFYLLCCIGDGYYEFPFLSAGNFELFGADGDDQDNPGFDSDEFEDGLELIALLHDTIPVNSTDLANKSSLKSAFMEGNAAYIITGSWDVTQFKESGVNFGVVPLPTYKGNALTPFAGVQCAHVSPYTDYPVAAQLLAAFLISDEGAGILFEEYNGITTLQDISGIAGLSDDEFIDSFVAQFSTAVPMPSVFRISYFWSIVQEVDKAVFDGTLSPAEGRKKAVDNWEALLSTE